jgi:hypothetical protein
LGRAPARRKKRNDLCEAFLLAQQSRMSRAIAVSPMRTAAVGFLITGSIHLPRQHRMENTVRQEALQPKVPYPAMRFPEETRRGARLVFSKGR